MRHDSRHMLSMNDRERLTAPQGILHENWSPVSPTGESALRGCLKSQTNRLLKRLAQMYFEHFSNSLLGRSRSQSWQSSAFWKSTPIVVGSHPLMSMVSSCCAGRPCGTIRRRGPPCSNA